MPTGYTVIIEDSPTEVSLRTYALRCARGLGYLDHQHDVDGLEVPPKERTVEAYVREHVQKRRDDLARLERMSPGDVAQAADTEYAQRRKDWEEYTAKEARRNARYDAILAKVNAWTPAPDMESLKRFMLQQIEISDHRSDIDDFAPKPIGSEEWLRLQFKWAKDRLAAAESELAHEQRRCAETNAWVKALYAEFPE